MVAIQDDGSRHVGAALGALKRVGATDPILRGFRGSYALVGYAEEKKPSYVKQVQRNRGKGPSVISLSVPRTRKCVQCISSKGNNYPSSDDIIFYPRMCYIIFDQSAPSISLALSSTCGFYIIKRKLHGRLEIRNFSSHVGQKNIYLYTTISGQYNVSIRIKGKMTSFFVFLFCIWHL